MLPARLRFRNQHGNRCSPEGPEPRDRVNLDPGAWENPFLKDMP
jgi:hypothetical protein